MKGEMWKTLPVAVVSGWVCRSQSAKRLISPFTFHILESIH